MEVMENFKQWELNRDLMYAIWEGLDKATYLEIMEILRRELSTGEYCCPGCGSVLSPKLLEVAPDEKKEQENFH